MRKSNDRKNKKSSRVLFIILVCLIVAAAAIAAALVIDNVIHAPDRVAKGVTLSGTDISGMTKEQVLAATSQIPQDLLANAEISVSFDGQITKFSAQDLGLTTDYDSVVAQAIADYIPEDANFSRFVYKNEENGSSVDVDALADRVVSQLTNGDSATIEAPIETIKPKVTLEDIKKDTQLISSWTSSYSNHFGYNRNWNVAKLSGIINGVVIQPGETWSINKQAGNRTTASGWLEAAGIELGGYTQQPGGGVCQISSTLYNAARRSALCIPDSSHHSITSDYIPL